MSVRAIQAGKAVILIQATDLTGQTLNKITNNMKRLGSTLTRVGEQSMRGGLLGGIATGMTLRNFFKFDDLMKELRAKFGFLGDMTMAQTKAMTMMEHRIRSLGKTTSYTSQEVAEAAVVLAQGGLSTTEVSNSLQAILDLGRGTRTALDMAADMYVRAMRSFNISADEANSTVSQFVRATRYGVLELSDLESGLRYSSGTAATLGQNLAPILAILTQLSNVGLAGSIGGTSLNTAMANLVKKLDKIKERFPGFEPATKNGDLDLLRTLERLYAYTSKLSKMERIEVFQDLFNLRGARAIAGAQDIESILGMAKAIAQAGNEARKAADLMDSGPGGAWRKLTSAVDDLSLSLGKAAEGPIVAIIHAATHLSNAFNKVVETNKPLATALVMSPILAVAAGVAFITLGKALGTLGTVLGVAVGGFRKLLGMISGGTVRQFIALKGTLQALRGGSVAHMGLGQMGHGAMTAGRFGTHGIVSAARSQRTLVTQTRIAKVAAQNAHRFRTMSKILAARGVAPNLARQYLRAANIQANIGRRATYSANLARGARLTALRSILPAIGTGLMDVVRGFRAFAVATGRTIWAVRRLIPSWFTLIEVFVLFGDKIPGVKNVWNQFANGFMAAGGALGRIASYIQGPINLLFASFDQLYKGDTATGLNGIMTALSGIGQIIVNQLVSAWNLFKASIAGTWDTVKVVFTAISQLVGNVINSLGSVLGLLGNAASSTIGGFFSGKGDFGSMIISGAQALMKGINQLFYWGDVFVAKLNQIFQDIIAELGAAISRLNPLNSNESIQQVLDSTINKNRLDYLIATKKREKTLNEQNLEVDRVFKSIAENQTKNQALQTARQRENWSANINQFTNNLAAQMRESMNQPSPVSPQGNTGYSPMRSNGLGSIPNAVQDAKSIASSIIGYASSNVSNQIKFGNKNAKKQLDILEDIRDNTSDLKDRAETFE